MPLFLFQPDPIDDYEFNPIPIDVHLGVIKIPTEEILALELLNPIYNKEHKTIEYNVINLDNSEAKNVILSDIGEGSDSNNINSSKSIDKFSTATLFIDSGCNPLDPRGCN